MKSFDNSQNGLLGLEDRAQQLAKLIEAGLRDAVAAVMLENALGHQILFHTLRRVTDLDALIGQEGVGLAGAETLIAGSELRVIAGEQQAIDVGR